MRLNSDVKEIDLLTVCHGSHKNSKLVVVPRCSRRDRFDKSAWKTKWINRMLDACITVDNMEDDGGLDLDNEIGRTQDDAATWIMGGKEPCRKCERTARDSPKRDGSTRKHHEQASERPRCPQQCPQQ